MRSERERCGAQYLLEQRIAIVRAGAKVAIYPSSATFIVDPLMTRSRVTAMCYLPGRIRRTATGRYINMGAVNKDFFTTQSMVKAAP